MIRVYGHIRSGNHFAASLIKQAFYPDDDFGSVVRRRDTGHWSRRGESDSPYSDGTRRATEPKVMIPYARLLGGHKLPTRRDSGVYVLRDGRDVILSCWRWEQMRPKGCETFAEFLRRSIDWRFSMGRRAPVRDGYTIVHHWRDHVAAWKKCKGVVVVRYEDLMTKHRRELRRISVRFGLPVRSFDGVNPVGWNAAKRPRVDRWKAEMSAEDAAFFASIAG